MAVGYNPRIVTDGLVLALDAANTKSYPGSGTTWTDMVGSGIGTLTNGPTFDSANGGSIVFDGIDDEVNNFSSSDFAAGTDNFSFSVWIRRNGSQIGGAGIISVSGSANWEFRVLEGGTMRIDAGGSVQLKYGSVNLPDLTWTNMSFVREGTGTNQSKLYVDGKFKASPNDPFTTNITGTDFVIGTDKAGNDFFGGNISIVKYYNRALTAAEIQQNFNALRGRYGI